MTEAAAVAQSTPAPSTPTQATPAAPQAAPAPEPALKMSPGRIALKLEDTEAAKAKPDAPASAPQAPPESDADKAPKGKDDLRVMRALSQLQKAQGEAAKHRAELEALRAEVEPIRAQHQELSELLTAAKDDPEKALVVLERAGWDFEKLARLAMDGKLKSPKRYADLPPEVAARIERLEAREKELAELETKRRADEAAQAELAKKEANRAADIEHVRSLASELDQVGTFEALPGVAEIVVARAYQALDAGETPDVAALIAETRDQVLAETRKLLASERIVRALCDDAQVRDTLLKALGVRASAVGRPGERRAGEGDGDGPRSLPTSLLSEVRTRNADGEELSPEERRRRLREASRSVLDSIKL